MRARRTSLVPDGKNTAAHDMSLDRYPVWRIRSFIGIDMFAVAWSVYFSRIHFYLLDIIMRFAVLRNTLGTHLNLIHFNC